MNDLEIDLAEPKDIKTYVASGSEKAELLADFLKIEGDPRFYRYHPRSTLALGRNFDHRDITDSKPAAIVSQPVWLDQGAPSSGVEVYYVRNQRELNQTAKRDIHIEGRYLAANASGGYSFDRISKFSSDSISVVFVATVDFGRKALQAGAALTVAASAKLAADPVAFARLYGRRYVSQQRQGAFLTAVITIDALDSYTKNSFTSTLSAGGGIGRFSAKAKAEFNKIAESASKQSRMRIEVGAVGGDGPEGLAKILTGYARDSADPFGDISSKLKAAMAGFSKENSATIEYTVSPMSDFGLDDSVLPPWYDAQEERLLALADDYRNTLKDLEIVEAYEGGAGPYPRLFPHFMEFALYNAENASEVRPIVERYRDAVKAQHASCLAGSGLRACQYPAGRYADQHSGHLFLNEDLRDRDTVPRAWFKVIAVTPTDDFVELDPVQSAIVLRNDPEARLGVVRYFEPAATGYYCWFVFGSARVVSYRWVTEWSDGTVRSQQGTGFGEMSINFSEEGIQGSRGDGEEQRILNWMASVSGSHSIRRKFVFIDKANREFEVTYLEATWSASGGQLQSGQVRFLGANGNVTRLF
ncbi:hypothetical protein [Roseibium album]|uniref:hypothetical protein n=1 Tax=Roseibium album TaxID=311410 RepID=UPI003299F2E0